MRVLITILIIALVMVASASQAGATTGATEIALSDSSALSTQTTYNVDGSYTTSNVALDTTATTATIASNGYLCGNVQYRATQRWYDPLGFVLWTYRSTFGVHVCNNKVTGKTALYDEAMDSNFGWSWCGNVVKTWAMNPNNASAHSYTKGCFTVFYKVAETRYPWAKMTIGGNGGLWVRDTGVS